MSASVVVIGSGILGASIAFHLSNRGARVTLLDAGEPGREASAASFAWINARDKNPRHYHDLNRRSLDIWDRFSRRLGGDIGLTWGGELRWAATPQGAEELAARVRTLQNWGYPIRLLDKAEAHRLEPDLNFDDLTAASYSELDGHVHTGRVIAACLKHASDRGAQTHPRTRVTGFDIAQTSGDPRIETVLARTGAFACDFAVLAAGADAPEIAALAGLDLPLDHTFGATLFTDPVPPVFRTIAAVHTPRDREPRINFRQLPDGSVQVHGSGPGGSLGQTDAEIAHIFEAAKRVVPALAPARIRDIRKARRPVPRDGCSILGFPQALPNLYLAATHSGVTLAPLIGEFAAAEILDNARIDLLEPYRIERFS